MNDEGKGTARPSMDLPDGWAMAELQAIAEVNPRADKGTYDDALEVSFVPMPAVETESGAMDVSTTRRLSEVKKGYTPFREGDVLFAKITPCMENGKMAVVPPLKNGLGFGSTEFHVLRPYDGVSGRYLYHFVSSRHFRRDAEHNMTGAVGQRRVPTPYIAKHRIPVPPTPEQVRIVANLDELFSELDKGIESLGLARAHLGIYRLSLLTAAFRGKLTAAWRTGHREALENAHGIRARLENARIQHHEEDLERWRDAVQSWERGGQIGRKPAKPRTPKTLSGLSGPENEDLPVLPEGWLWERLGWMTCGVEYGTAAKSAPAGKVAVLRMGNIQNAKLDWSDLVFTSDEEEIASYWLQPGDVLFNRTNSPELVGKTAIYRGEQPAIFAGYLIRVNHIPRVVDGQYLNLFLNSHIARVHGNRVKTDGVNQSNINGDKLVNYPFPYCSLQEQREIARILEEKLSLIDDMTAQIASELRRAQGIRQTILARAFSGRLLPQNPSDEPAALLLERIAKDRYVVNSGVAGQENTWHRKRVARKRKVAT